LSSWGDAPRFDISFLGRCQVLAFPSWGDAPSFDIKGFQPYSFLIFNAALFVVAFYLYSHRQW